MEFRHLASFLAVSDTLHFGQAAERLHLSQPALSRQIQQLERELGVLLFERSGRRVVLTSAGQTLAIYAHRMLDDMREARFAVHQPSSDLRGHIAIGCFDSASAHIMPGILATLHSRHPHLAVSVTTLGTDEAVRAIHQRELDGAIVTLPVPTERVRVVPLYREELLLALPPHHALTGRRRVPMAALRDEQLITFRGGQNTRRLIDQAFATTGDAAAVVIELESVEAIKGAVRAGLGIAILGALGLQERTRGGGLITRPLMPAIYRSIGLIRRTDRSTSLLMAQFTQAVIQHVQTLSPSAILEVAGTADDLPSVTAQGRAPKLRSVHAPQPMDEPGLSGT